MDYLDLLSALAKAQSDEDSELRMLLTVATLGEGLPAEAVYLYMIQLSSGTYVERASWPAPDDSNIELHAAIELAASRRVRVSLGDFIAAPIVRGDNVPAVIVIRGAGNFSYWRGLESALSPLANVQLDRRSSRVLENLNPRIDLRLEDEEFYAALGQNVLQASGMQYAALRLLRAPRLECVAVWGFVDPPSLVDLSFDIEHYAEFSRAASGTTVAVADLSDSTSRNLQAIPELAGVHAFVAIPVQNASGVFGVLTLATTARYSFAPSEVRAFEALGGSVAATVSTYTASGTDLTLPQLRDLSMRSTIETIAASARHAGLQLIDNAVDAIALAKKEKDLEKRDGYLSQVEDDLTSMHYLFERMRFALKPPQYLWAKQDLTELWKSAVDQFNARLDILQIKVRSPVRSHETWIYPDWIRMVFIQLLINSVDAFAGKGKGLNAPAKIGREIRLEILELTGERLIRLRYSDNAGGISSQNVSSRKEDDALPLGERIFRPEASAKGAQGTGWGLPLVRKAVAQHRGSVFLAENSKRGVVFDILLPAQADSRTKN